MTAVRAHAQEEYLAARAITGGELEAACTSLGFASARYQHSLAEGCEYA